MQTLIINNVLAMFVNFFLDRRICELAFSHSNEVGIALGVVIVVVCLIVVAIIVLVAQYWWRCVCVCM